MHCPRIDKSVLTVGSLTDLSDEKAYWLSKTPQERLAAIELMRQILCGHDPDTTRMEKVFEIGHLVRTNQACRQDTGGIRGPAG